MKKTNCDQLLLNNKKWVKETTEMDTDFFNRLSKIQNPKYLWIGCSDSRVPANEITGTRPGEIFVTRNIANNVIHTDMSMLSVLDFAVNILKVKHVIVCGHYNCGGLKAAMSSKQYGLIDNWIRHIKDTYMLYHEELDIIQDSKQREDRFAEINVIENVGDLSQTSIIQNAWRKRKGPWVHGWIYDLSNGYLKDLNISMNNNSQIPDIYKLKHS